MSRECGTETDDRGGRPYNASRLHGLSRVGHTYLHSLKDDPTIEHLAAIFQDKIVPLLQEYFYDDYAKIQLVLGDNQMSDYGVEYSVNVDADFSKCLTKRGMTHYSKALA